MSTSPASTGAEQADANHAPIEVAAAVAAPLVPSSMPACSDDSPAEAETGKLLLRKRIRKSQRSTQTPPVITRPAGVQVDIRPANDELHTRHLEELHASSRVIDGDPHMVSIIAEHQLHTKFSVKARNVRLGTVTETPLDVDRLHEAELVEPRTLSATAAMRAAMAQFLHMHTTPDQHLSTCTERGAQDSGPTLHMRVLAVAQRDTRGAYTVHTLRVSAEADWAAGSAQFHAKVQHYVALRDVTTVLYHALDDTQLAAAATQLSQHCFGQPVFHMDTLLCNTGTLKRSVWTLDEALANMPAARLRQSLAHFVESSREQMKAWLVSHSRVHVVHPSQALAGQAAQAKRAGELHDQPLSLTRAKLSDWICLARSEVAMGQQQQLVELQVFMRYRRQLFDEEQWAALAKLDSALQARSIQHIMGAKRHLCRFIVQAQNLNTGAVVRYATTFAQLLSLQKYGLVARAEAVIRGLEQEETMQHQALLSKLLALRHESAAGRQSWAEHVVHMLTPPPFHCRDEAANAIQGAVRRWLIRLHLRSVAKLRAMITGSVQARQDVSRTMAVPRSSNIRQWVTNVSAWDTANAKARTIVAARNQQLGQAAASTGRHPVMSLSQLARVEYVSTLLPQSRPA